MSKKLTFNINKKKSKDTTQIFDSTIEVQLRKPCQPNLEYDEFLKPNKMNPSKFLTKSMHDTTPKLLLQNKRRY
jgi:hypothetical protein